MFEVYNMLPLKRHKVSIIRNADTETEERQDNVPGDIQAKKSFFEMNVDIRKGDIVIVPFLDEPQIVKKLFVYADDPLEHKEVLLVPKSEYLESQKTVESSIHQEIHGNVGSVAGRDITINNIKANIYLEAIAKAIDDSDDIPTDKKKDLIHRLVEIKDDHYIKTLGAAAIVEAIKQLFMQS